MYEDAGALSWDPLVDVIRRNFRKQEVALACPYRTFGPLVESGSHALQFGIRRHQMIDRWVEFLNVLRKRRHGEGRQY